MSEAKAKHWVCDLPINHPKRVLAVLILLSSVLGLGFFRLGFDPSTERVFPDGHWAVETYQRFREVFGGDEAIFVGFETDQVDVFNSRDLALTHTIARRAEAIEGVRQAFALADMPVLEQKQLPGLFVPIPVLERGLPKEPGQASEAQVRRFKERFPEFMNRVVVSGDRRATMVMVRLKALDSGIEGAELNKKIVRQVQDLVDDLEGKHPDRRFFLAGSPLIKAKIMQDIQDDVVRFSGPLVLIALVVSGLVLRSVTGMLLVLGVLLVSLDLTMGTMGYLGIPLDPMTTLVPTLLLVIGVADSLHLLVEQRAQAAILGPQATGAETIRAALDHVLVPCFLTSITTAIGFGSLVVSPVPPIRRFGIAAALACLTAFLVTIILIPAVAALLEPPGAGTQEKPFRLDRFANRVLARPWLSLAIGVGIAVVLGLGWLRVVSNTNFLKFFPAEDRLVRDAMEIQNRFSGIAPCELLVIGKPGDSYRPEVLQAIHDLERDLEQLSFVDRTFSVADVVAVARGRMLGKQEPVLPKSEQEVKQVRALIDRLAGQTIEMDQFVSKDDARHPGEEWIRVTVRAHAVGSARFEELIERVKVLERKHLGKVGVTVKPTGTSVVFSQTADTIMNGQIQSFLVAFLVITVALICALGSLRLGLLSAVPNIVPIAALLGAMGYLGIEFNSFNSMVGTIAIGIAVDDTIHILAGYKRFSSRLPRREAVAETIAHEGTALLSTSAVLFAGFSVLLIASYLPTAHFGLLTAIAIGSALLGDLVILPALLIVLPMPSGRQAETPPPSEEDGGVTPNEGDADASA